MSDISKKKEQLLREKEIDLTLLDLKALDMIVGGSAGESNGNNGNGGNGNDGGIGQFGFFGYGGSAEGGYDGGSDGN